MFQSSGNTPKHDTTNASELLNDYYYSRADSMWVYRLDSRTEAFGTDQAETIVGTSGADALDGNVADPEAQGGDVLIGREGSDIYFLSDNYTRIIEEAGGGHDTVVTTVDLDLAQHVNMAGKASEIEAIELWGANDVTVDASAATWNVAIRAMGTGNMTIHGGSGKDNIAGNTGDDFIFGNDGNDAMYGRAGNDTMNGGAGDDYIRGDAGNDVLTGGTGADEFIFDSREGAAHDVITDWEAGVDHCVVAEVDMYALTFQQTAEGTLMTYAQDCTVLFQGVNENEISMADFTFYYDDASTL
jgi:Ca2+-binding RTX toxin-like protein